MAINIKNKVVLKDVLNFVPLKVGEIPEPIQLDPDEMYPDHPIQLLSWPETNEVSSAQNLADISTIANVNGMPTGVPANRGWQFVSYDTLRIDYNHTQYEIIADLIGNYHLDYCYMYCGQNQPIKVYAKNENTDWSLLGGATVGDSWQKIDFSGDGRGGARYVKFGTAYETGSILSVVFYGRKIKENLITGKKIKNLTVKRPINTMIGTNGFYFEDADLEKEVSDNSRFYIQMDWVMDDPLRETNGGVNFPTLNDIALKFETSHMGNIDMLLKGFSNTDQRIMFTMNDFPQYLISYWQPNSAVRPVDPGLDRYDYSVTTNPLNYSHMARLAYILTARYGNNPNANIQGLKIAPGNTAKVGLNTITALEFGNETDAFWIRDARIAPEEQAALMSALYDGHMGQLGERMGVKAADSAMLLSMGSLSTPENTTFVHTMKIWWDKHRGEGNYPIDIINYHFYNSTGETQRAKGNIIALPPEKGDMVYMIDMWEKYRALHMPSVEVWCTETGYDEHNGGVHSPFDRTQFERSRHKAWWLIRIMLVSAYGNMDATNQYWFANVGGARLEDLDPNTPLPDAFASSAYVDGDVIGSAFYGRTPLMSFYYMRSFKKAVFDFYYVHAIMVNGVSRTHETIIETNNTQVWALAFKNYKTGQDLIVIWMGEEVFEETSVYINVNESSLDVGDFEEAEIKLLDNVNITRVSSQLVGSQRKIQVPINGCPKFIYTTNLGTSKPIEPYDIKIQKQSNGDNLVVWTDQNKENYPVWIQRSVLPNSGFTTIHTDTLLKPEFVDINVPNQSVSYYYKVTYIEPEDTPPGPDPEPEPSPEPEPKTDPYIVGTGSGQLTISGLDPDLAGKDYIVVKQGNYTAIWLEDIQGTRENPIFIKNEGNVTFKRLNVDKCSELIIAGDNDSNIAYGFSCTDPDFRPLQISGFFKGITYKNISMKNWNDYLFNTDMYKVDYDGTSATTFERLRFIYCKFDNAGQMQIGGNVYSTEDNGYMTGFEFAYNQILNSDAGVHIFGANLQDYKVHHNIGKNLNPINTNHNGIFHLTGVGEFHSNKIEVSQGNILRAWTYRRIGSSSVLKVYNNIYYSTTKYGAFEIQEKISLVPGKTTWVDAEIYNNTAGNLNTNKDWDAVMLDLYNYGGTLKYYNNLGFDMFRSGGRPIGNMINNMSDVEIILDENNVYKNNSIDAVVNTVNYKSKFPGIGAGEMEVEVEEVWPDPVLGSNRAVLKTSPENTSPWSYYEYLPGNYSEREEWPILIYLGGTGEAGDGSAGQLTKLISGSLPKLINDGNYNQNFVTLCPQWLDVGLTNWSNETLLRDFIIYVKGKYKVNTDKIYLTGLSAGGEYVMYYLEHYPTTHGIAASVLISCSLEENWISASGVAAANSPMWWMTNMRDDFAPWNSNSGAFRSVTASVAAINAIKPNLTQLTGFDTDGHDGGTWKGIYDSSLIGTGHSSYNNFNEPIYNWLLRHNLI